MRVLARPARGRIVGGVAAAFAERYELNVWIIRLVIFAAIITSNIGILFYLVLWISIPSERMVLGSLRITSIPGERLNPKMHFDRLASAALERINSAKDREGSYSKMPLALMLLCLSFLLLFPRWSGSGMYFNPLLVSSSTLLQHIGATFFFFSFALLFLLAWPAKRPHVFLAQPDTDRLTIDKSERKVLYGVLAGLGSELGIDAAYLRGITLVLNVLTLGVIGVVYLVTAWVLEKKKRELRSVVVYPENAEGHSRRMPKLARAGMGVLFLLLAIINLATEYRWFFFNEPFAEGIVYIILGMMLSLWALRFSERGGRHRSFLLIGPGVFFYGIYEFTMAVFRVQLPFFARFEMAYMITGTAFIYYAIVNLHDHRRTTAVAIGVMMYALSFLIQFGVISSHALVIATQFYDFFYPILFAAAGVWLAMERSN